MSGIRGDSHARAVNAQFCHIAVVTCEADPVSGVARAWFASEPSLIARPAWAASCRVEGSQGLGNGCRLRRHQLGDSAARVTDNTFVCLRSRGQEGLTSSVQLRKSSRQFLNFQNGARRTGTPTGTHRTSRTPRTPQPGKPPRSPVSQTEGPTAARGSSVTRARNQENAVGRAILSIVLLSLLLLASVSEKDSAVKDER